MKTQTYIVMRSTLLPAEDSAWVELKPKSRGNDQVKGKIEIFCILGDVPPIGSEVMVEVKWENK